MSVVKRAWLRPKKPAQPCRRCWQFRRELKNGLCATCRKSAEKAK